MPTMDALNALANDIPQLNARAAQTAQGLATTKQQAAIQQANLGGGSATAAAQSAAPAGIAAQVQPLVQAQQQTTQQLSQVGQMGVEAQATADQAAQATQENAVKQQQAAAVNQQQLAQVNADLAMRKRVTAAEEASAQRLQATGIEQDNKLQFLTIRQRQQLAALGGDVQDQIQASRLRFERDDMGRKFSDQRQLADYTVANAATDIEFKQKMQDVQQLSQRNLQMMEIVDQQMRQVVQNQWQVNEQEQENLHKEKIIALNEQWQLALKKAQAKAANNMAMWQAGGTIVGAVVGGVVAGYFTAGTGTAAGAAGGAAAGAAVGGALGTAVGGAQQGTTTPQQTVNPGPRPGSTAQPSSTGGTNG